MALQLGNRIARFYADTIDFVFPMLCAGCGNVCEEHSLCGACQKKFQTYEHPFCLGCQEMILDGIRCQQCKDKSFPLFAMGDYVDPLKEIIKQVKFRGITEPVRKLAATHAEMIAPYLSELQTTHFVPIPLHTDREYVRGYNQAALLAQALGEKLSVPVCSEIIWRIEKRKEQARLSFESRAGNIKGVFESVAADEVEKTWRLVLVDDVVTSGHTVHEAAHTLRAAGYTVVGVASIAHGL